MDSQKSINTRTELLEILITISSVLGIAGYFLNNPTFFSTAGGVSAALVVMLSTFSWVMTPKPIRAIFGIYGVIFVLLETIGCLVAREPGTGLLLGTCFAGLGIVALSKYLVWVNGRLTGNAPERLSQYDNPLEKEEGERTLSCPSFWMRTLPRRTG